MFKFVKKVIALPFRTLNILKLDKMEVEIQKYFISKPALVSKASPNLILVQCVQDKYFYYLFGQIINSISKVQSCAVELNVMDSFREAESKNIFRYINSRVEVFMNTLKWKRLYAPFSNGIAFKSIGIQAPILDLVDMFRAFVIWKNLKTKDKLISLVIKDVLVGDLIYDTYLRFKPAPTVNLRDMYLCILIWQSFRNIRRAKKYLSKNKPKLYLTSYSSYVQHGIAVRIALANNIRVLSFGNLQVFSKELHLYDWMHTANTTDYLSDFLKLDNQEQKISEAEEALRSRMSGVVDGAYSYMAKSAYAKSNDIVPDVRNSIIIFLHDFFDSPHIYHGGMVFADFWEWICFTIEYLNKLNIPFYIKPHPNQVELSKDVISKLEYEYPTVSVLPSSITNKILVDNGIACAVTVYGTVAHEMAYLGVPTIACGDNPHTSFNICYTAKDINQYKNLLSKYKVLGFDIDKSKKDSLMFYYMHYLNLNSDDKLLRDNIIKLSDITNKNKNTELTELLNDISELPGFKKYISSVVEHMALS